jgi:hypothetical protein
MNASRFPLSPQQYPVLDVSVSSWLDAQMPITRPMYAISIYHSLEQSCKFGTAAAREDLEIPGPLRTKSQIMQMLPGYLRASDKHNHIYHGEDISSKRYCELERFFTDDAKVLKLIHQGKEVADSDALLEKGNYTAIVFGGTACIRESTLI